MRKINPSIVVYLSGIFLMFSLGSCYQSRMVSVNNNLSKSRIYFLKEDSMLNMLLQKKQQKLLEQVIDDSTSIKIDRKLAGYLKNNDSIEQKLSTIDSLMVSRRSLRKSYKGKIRPMVLLLQTNLKNDSAAFASRMLKYYMIDDVLNRAKLNLFSSAAFFAPGEFKIMDENIALITTSFMPIIDSLMAFNNKYAAIAREVTLAIYGYADGTAISAPSELASFLLEKMGKQSASNQELNKELSRLRADELNTAMMELLKMRMVSFLGIDKLTMANIVKGNGEQYPNPNIKDYAVDDERRRIVLLYWSVLPE